MRFHRVLLAALLVALCFVPAAQARTIKLNWVEKISYDYGYQPMTFKVKDVVVTSKAWAVHATIVNRSKFSLRVVPPVVDDTPSHYGFSLLWAPKCAPPANSCRLDERRATYFKPRFPTPLRAGTNWRGVFGGPGLPPRRKLIYIGFGFFHASATVNFDWVTQRAFKL